jgi:hypothetical protein
MSMTPYKIILNAQGQSDSFQSVLHMSLPSDYQLIDYQVELYINDILVSTAYDFRYCYIDDNFLAQFDRAEVLDTLQLLDLESDIATAKVLGWYYAENASGDSLLRNFEGIDTVEILAPGRK